MVRQLLLAPLKVLIVNNRTRKHNTGKHKIQQLIATCTHLLRTNFSHRSYNIILTTSSLNASLHV